MAVDFCDYFWGEKHDGFQVLYQNMKSGLTATKDLTDVVRETAIMQEYNSKAYAKISKQLGSAVQIGSFGPMLLALKTASEKLSAIHLATLAKVSELVKELVKYSDDLHKKHKMLKDEESPTSDVVKSLQETTVLLHKSKEFYKAKTSELEKLKRENPTPKELEKAEIKFRKAQEEYRNLCDKYTNIREDFEKKMMSSCKHFQQNETLYLTQMVDFVHSFHDLIDCNHNDMGKVNLELEENLVQNTVEKMLEQFVLQKYTGLVKPGPIEFEAENISLTSLNAATAISGGPPSDISDRSANSANSLSTDKGPVGSRKETSGEEAKLDDNKFVSLNGEPPGFVVGEGGGASTVPESPSSSLPENSRSPYATLANWSSVTGFLKNRRKKDRKKSTKAKDDPENENKDIGSDGEERGRSETPTPEHNDEDGFKNPPPPSEANDPWADFNQSNKKSFYSSSDSDTDDEEVKKIKINIRPVGAGPVRAATSASVDELQKAVIGIDLNAATLPKRPTPSIEVEAAGVKRSQSTIHMAKGSHSQDLLGLFPALDTSAGTDVSGEGLSASGGTEFHSVSGGLPGAESTRIGQLDTSEVSHHSNTSKEVSDLLNDIHDLNNDIQDATKNNYEVPPELPTSQPPPLFPESNNISWPDSNSSNFPQSSSSAFGEIAGAESNFGNASTAFGETAGAQSDFGSSSSAFGDTVGAQSSFGDSTQPPLPQKTRPMSAQREKVANSLIPLPRPPSRARPEPRLRGTPSPTPTSLLQTTALSIHRSDSTGSGSRSNSSPTAEVLKLRTGPLLPPPRADSPGRPGRPDSPLSTPPSNPPPMLHHNFSTTSRGPSPLTLGGADCVPLAVAFQEVVHAAFRGAEESRCLVRLIGDMMLSFPAGIVSVLASNPYPAPLQFKIRNSGRLESVLPNKQLITKVKNACTEDILVFEFNMQSLQELLNKQSQMNPHASYFNIDILKYQISTLSGANSCPFHIMSYWRCEEGHTDLRIDYKYNQHAMARPTALQNVSLAVPVDGGVTSMMSEPKGTWVQESNRAMWKFPDISSTNANAGVGSIRARFQLTDGPGSQGTIAAQFNCEGTTLSGVEFELSGAGYRVSLVKRRFVSGKYVSEPDHTTDRFRYAAPPSLGSDC
eukprot:GFUD01032925.1.p1 GENE.GFUD01032925.1~~GFUD01032925.1.p1  ORF type:complete len:1132 (+),score=298.80 GFUD01032925.1:199-3594(+)